MECRSKLVALMEFVYKPNCLAFTMGSQCYAVFTIYSELFSAFVECFALCVSMKVLKRIYTDAGEEGCEGRDLETRGEV